MTLLTLKYGSRMELTQEARHRVEREGISFREAQCVVELDLFLDEYPWWDLGTPHWPVILHEMFLHATTRGWKEAEHMCQRGHLSRVREPDLEMDQTALQLIGYCTSWKELRNVYLSVYLLNRALGSPPCGAAQ